MHGYVFDLDAKPSLDPSRAGGKGASLARLRRSHFNVPPGFIIAPAASEAFYTAAGVDRSTIGKSLPEDELARLRAQILGAPVPSRVAAAIADAYRRLGGRVAVRSSMVGEDAYLASFAGQLDTILDVQGPEQVLEAVRQCWAGLFNARLASYADQRASVVGEPNCARAMAVVVQRLVEARSAGVAFSADPVTGQRCVVVEAVRGLGDALVGGLVRPDRYVVDARGVLAEVDPAGDGEPVLGEAEVLRLAGIVREVGSRRSCPQDVEWAWDGHEFHLLQARPITSLAGKTVYSTRMISEWSPGMIKPLVYSTNTTSMAKHTFARVFAELIGPNDLDSGRLITRIHSRLFMNMTLLGEVFERMALPANFLEMMMRDERAGGRRPGFDWRMLRVMPRLLGIAWRQGRAADRASEFVERHHRELEPFRSARWASHSPQQLLASFAELARLHRETQWFILVSAMNMHIRNRMLRVFVERRAPEVAPGDLVRGLVGLKALEPNRQLQRLAGQARELDDDTRSVLATGDDATVRQLLATGDTGRALARDVDAFLARYGFLSTNGTDFSLTPWAENPALIWHAIGRAAAGGVQFTTDAVETTRAEAPARVRAHLNPVQRAFFDRLLASTIRFIDLRERTSLLMSEDSFHMRQIFLALAAGMLECGALTARDDIFLLTYPEIEQIVNGNLEPPTARDMVRVRRAEMQADAEIELPDTFCGDNPPVCPASFDEYHEYLSGIGSSTGVARGHARVVQDPASAPGSLTRDDILVVPFTDVGWTPLLAGIGGIVAETGGQLSHTSIVAREYGLPAVVGVKKATRIIGDRQPVTVDGSRGRVYLEPVAN